MSHSFNTSIFGGLKADLGYHLVSLFSRMEASLPLIAIRRIRRGPTLSSGDEVPVCRFDDRLERLVDDVLDSDEQLEVRIVVSFEGEGPRRIDFRIYGDHSAGGLNQQTWGAIFVQHLTRAFKGRPLVKLRDRENIITWEEGDPVTGSPRGEFFWHYERAYRFFGFLAGLDVLAGDGWTPKHVICHYESSDQWPLDAHMVAHRELSNFALDFSFLKQRYRFGALGPVFYSDDIEFAPQSAWDRRGIRREDLIRPLSECYQRDEPTHKSEIARRKATIELIERLDDTTIQHMKDADEDKLEYWLEHAALDTDTKWRRGTKGSGAAVFTPYARLQEFYERLWQLVEDDAAELARSHTN